MNWIEHTEEQDLAFGYMVELIYRALEANS